MDARKIEHVNQLLRLLGAEGRKFSRREDRALLRSFLFNVPGRISMGGMCYCENLIPFLREVTSHTSPEEIGKRMKGLAVLPNYFCLTVMTSVYLNGRQRQLLQQGIKPGQPWPEDKVEDLVFLLDFWERTARAYRNDGLLLPSQGGETMPILSREDIERVKAHLRPRSPSERKRVERMMATVELFTFILHGEQRQGIFNHGPYPLGEGQVLAVRELVGLRDDYYPWADTRARIPFPNIIRAMALRGVKAVFDFLGTMTTEPPNYGEAIVAEALFSRQGNELYELSLEDVEKVTVQAANAQSELYLKAAEWPARFKTAYGGILYAHVFKHFPEIAGVNKDIQQRIKEAFQQSVDRHVDSFMDEAQEVRYGQLTMGADEPYTPCFLPEK